MARLGRLFLPGYPLLLLLRGNNATQIFRDEVDSQCYLRFLRDGIRELSVSLHAYALLPDHVHLLISAGDRNAPGALMQRVGRRYVRWFNDKHSRSGTLWEGRYRSTAVEPTQFALACCRYIELNPVRRGLVPDPAAYAWSSCRHHLGLVADPLVSDHVSYWGLGNTPFERQVRYRCLLDAGSQPEELDAIRYAGHRGWLLGPPPSTLLESEPGRRVAPLPKGRPRKSSPR